MNPAAWPKLKMMSPNASLAKRPTPQPEHHQLNFSSYGHCSEQFSVRSPSKFHGELDLPRRGRRLGQQSRFPVEGTGFIEDVRSGYTSSCQWRGKVGVIQNIEDLHPELRVE